MHPTPEERQRARQNCRRRHFSSAPRAVVQVQQAIIRGAARTRSRNCSRIHEDQAWFLKPGIVGRLLDGVAARIREAEALTGDTCLAEAKRHGFSDRQIAAIAACVRDT